MDANTLLLILTRTPVWVWALLAALLALGFAQMRSRQVAPARVLLLPAALGALGLWSMAPGFVAEPGSAVAWAAALGGAAWLRLGVGAPAGARWLADTRRLALPGSRLPLAFIVVIFSLRYANGVSLAMHPQWHGVPPWQWPLALAFGALTGALLGRSLALWRLSRTVQTPRVHAPAQNAGA